MIRINKNTINDCVFTLRENSLLWNESGITPYYLFQFTNQQTQETKLFVADNVASFSAQSRYDEFYIVETGNTYTNLSAATSKFRIALDKS